MKNKDSSFILVLNYLGGLLIVFLMGFFLPDKYFGDSETIKTFIPEATFRVNIGGEDSYINTAFFYKILGFGEILPDWVAGVIGYSLTFFLTVLIFKKLKYYINPMTAALFFGWNILLAIYMGMFSKEPVTFLVCFGFFLLASTNRGLVAGLALVLLYATFYRIYWFLVAGFFFVNLVLIRWKHSLALTVFSQIVVALGIFWLANVATGQYLSDFRLLATEKELEVEITTIVPNIFQNSSSVHDWLNAVCGWAILIFPFYLILSGEFQHLLFMVFQLVNLALFVLSARYLLKNISSVERYFGRKIRRLVEVSLAWCIAYSFIQGVFEPDFGSFSRHQVVLLPMLLLLFITYFRLKILNGKKMPSHPFLEARPT